MRVSYVETLQLALAAVWSHRLRALLTILGIVIGITTVVTVSSLLTGLRKGMVVFFEEFGPDNVFLDRFSHGPGSPSPAKQRRRKPILPEYADLIRQASPSVQETAVSLFVEMGFGAPPLIAKAGSLENDQISLVGVSASHLNVQPRDLRAGRVFTPEEAAHAARVALIGSVLADSLFPSGDAVGSTMQVGGGEYTVVGVLAPAKGGFFGENVFDRQITIPLRTAENRYPQSNRYLITIRAREGLRDLAFDEVRSLMRRFRRVPSGAEDDFALTTADQIIAQLDRVTGVILSVSISISALGLLVGGIGVMNIMLVSVTERTREIGIRKAVGARRGDIVQQFLLEAIALTGSGGLLGIVIAIAVTLLVGSLVPSLPSEVPPWAVAAGFSVSVLVGLFFGVWPAVKASRLDPVDALRHE